MADEPHVDLLELAYEARLATIALILGVGGLMKQASTPELVASAHYLQQAGAAIDAAEMLLRHRPLPLAPLVADAPANVVAFRGSR